MQSVIEHQSVGSRRAGVEALRRIVSAPRKTGDQLLSIRNYLGCRRVRGEREHTPSSSLLSQRVSAVGRSPRVLERSKRGSGRAGRLGDRASGALSNRSNRKSIIARILSYRSAKSRRRGASSSGGTSSSGGSSPRPGRPERPGRGSGKIARGLQALRLSLTAKARLAARLAGRVPAVASVRLKGPGLTSLRLSGPGELHIAFGASIVLAVLVAGFLLQPGQALHGMVQRSPELSLPSDGVVETLRTRLASRDERYDASADLEVDVSGFLGVDTVEYELRSGDTLSGIAVQNGLRLDTLVSFNRISDARRMRAGDSIKIPNRDGVLHTVSRGESLESIARTHDSSVNALLDANDLESARIDPGDLLFVPEARMDGTELAIILGDAFRWPVRGRLSSGFGMRRDPFTGTRRFHNGVDIVNRPGTRVNAAMSGRVVHVENQPGNYGKFVIMRHPRGYQTLYAHLDRTAVSTGQYLSQGQQVGMLGNTGRSTGPHLHFSIIENGQFIDPMRHLR